jgi:hypothetical protein
MKDSAASQNVTISALDLALGLLVGDGIAAGLDQIGGLDGRDLGIFERHGGRAVGGAEPKLAAHLPAADRGREAREPRGGAADLTNR